MTFVKWNATTLGKRLNDRMLLFRSAKWIIEHNVIVGNMLAVDATGKPTGRGQLPLIEYIFNPTTLSVAVMKTTVGDVMEAEAAKLGATPSLFGQGPEMLWQGKAVNLAEAGASRLPSFRAQRGAGQENVHESRLLAALPA